MKIENAMVMLVLILLALVVASHYAPSLIGAILHGH